MKSTTLKHALILLAALLLASPAALPAAEPAKLPAKPNILIILADHADLKLALEDNGNIAGVELNGDKLPKGTAGGFFLREPNSAKKVSMVGSSVSKDGKLHLTLTSPLQANVRAVLTEGEGFIEVVGELEELTGKDRGLWLGFNLPVNTMGWKWGKTLSISPVITKEAPGYANEGRESNNNMVPIPAVWNDKGGISLCIPPSDPCVFEVGADADGLRIQMAFGLSKDTKNSPRRPLSVSAFTPSMAPGVSATPWRNIMTGIPNTIVLTRRS